jgi:hypothetical protein
MATTPTYQVELSMKPDTVSALIDGGYFLYALFAVEMTNGAARPTIWSATQSITANMPVEFSATVSAYTTSSDITSGGEIQIGYETQIGLGQTLEVTAGGVGQVKTEGPASKITVANTTSTQFTSGFSRPNGGQSVPIFAVPLYGNQSNVAAPLPKALLQISTEKLEPGTVVESFVPKSATLASYNPSLLVTATDGGTRQVTYDINTGWNWGDYSWAQFIPASADLAKVLIERE